MATTHHQPLLDTPKKNPTFSCKALFLFLSAAAIICPSAFVAFHVINNKTTPFLSLPPQLCSRVHGPASCLQIFLNNSVSRIAEAIDAANHISHRSNDVREQAPLADCVELMDLSIDRVKDSAVAIGDGSTRSSLADAHAWLSSVLTNYETCLDGLNSGPAHSSMQVQLQDLIARARTSLAMFTAISPSDEEAFRPLHGGFPSWVTSMDRKLLESLPKDINPNADVVVAKDGSGNYKTVQEAVASAPDNGKTRYVIYVKKGTYKENVEVGKKKTNVMIVGDGMDSTIITGSLNVVDGSTTFKSATVAAVATGFIAQDIWFKNTAGAVKHQAVALRVGADQSVINRCRISAYQDTLYAHTLRQFYRDCYITGTVDFIFGNAAVVFQNCKLVARKPMSGQKNMVTAQGRTDPNQNTGTSIQNCQILPSSDLAPLKSSFPTYLGRPWKEYSRTVVMQSSISDHIDPQGWFPWDGDFALKTLYYGEYSNRGAGAGTSKRVKWPGYHVITNAAEAKKFTVAELIQGGAWLKSTGVTYTEGL
ncbi:pectinesterase-like [Macadamia integrifolia]|uniref:pectinesterase-like n=1 Tax=Macadamia integrifolia TaxID=60698 RepID=UPI001C4FA80E|nr:pectinesterase-like [Macadamia integrifolia]